MVVITQDELSEDNFNMSKQPIILREEPHHASGFSSFGAPPQYYGSRWIIAKSLQNI